MNIRWTLAALLVAAICASFGAGVTVGVLVAGPRLIKAHCFADEPVGISRAVWWTGVCAGMAEASGRGVAR